MIKAKGGKRPDLDNRYFRSSWEANYARYLNLLVSQIEIVAWEYEPDTFEFHNIKRGTRFYKPDFKVYLFPFPDGGYEYHEVKGYMTPKSKTQLKRMAKYYPNEKIVIIGASFFADAKRTGLDVIIKGWE